MKKRQHSEMVAHNKYLLNKIHFESRGENGTNIAPVQHVYNPLEQARSGSTKLSNDVGSQNLSNRANVIKNDDVMVAQNEKSEMTEENENRFW